MLRRHVIDAWFPRSLDLEWGGFFCDFDRRWRSCGPHTKLLEFQARQTLFAAEAARAYPDDRRLHDAMVHGLTFLRERMWDEDGGGWFHAVDRTGRPLGSHTKHVHGAAYAIQACVAAYQATGDRHILDLALNGFDWLEAFAHDREYPGYFGFLTRNGTMIRSESDCPWPSDIDPIGTPIGYKDLNVHSDLLEAFTFLYAVHRDPRVGQRLAEVIEIVCERAAAPGGGLHFYCAADWRPVPHLARFGTQFQTAFRLLLARDLAGDAEKMRSLASGLMDNSLRYARDRDRGGFFFAGPATAPMSIEGEPVSVRVKLWWIQFEALKALFTAAREYSEDRYTADLLAHWSYIRRTFIDDRWGGVYSRALDSPPRWQRGWASIFGGEDGTRKGQVWKDSSHDGRALLHCAAVLRHGALPIAPPLATETGRNGGGPAMS
jgi:mannobiose 2-epimerase